MKTHYLFSILIVCVSCIAFMACEQRATIETIVNRDGSIQRNITFAEEDSAIASKNVFRIGRNSGWSVLKEESLKEGKYNVKFSRKFASVEEMNNAMNAADDTSFRIRSQIEEKFKWFYTYYRYEDTYVSINRLKYIDQNDYFTPEDFAFIDRLPAEGKPLSKADSFYLDKLGSRIFEDFASRGFYEESFAAMIQALEKNNISDQWIDSMRVRKESYFSDLLSEKSNDPDFDFGPLFRSIKGFPSDTGRVNDTYKELIREFEQRSDFMSTAVNLKLTHELELPWTVIETNADSISGNKAWWFPPSVKYTLKDYTMYAKGRSMNTWAVALSAAIVILTLILFFRKKPQAIDTQPR